MSASDRSTLHNLGLSSVGLSSLPLSQPASAESCCLPPPALWSINTADEHLPWSSLILQESELSRRHSFVWFALAATDVFAFAERYIKQLLKEALAVLCSCTFLATSLHLLWHSATLRLTPLASRIGMPSFVHRFITFSATDLYMSLQSHCTLVLSPCSSRT